MKKTTLLLLTSCALAGCYTAPEMTENKYRDFYSDESICGTSTMYQNEKLRECIEKRLAEEDKNKKTVTILPMPNGDTLIVPKTEDDAELKDINRVYEIVEVKTQTSVVIEEGQMTAAETTEETAEKTEAKEENITVIEDTVEAQEGIIEELIEEVDELKEFEASEGQDNEENESAEAEDYSETVEVEETSETIVEENDQTTTTKQMADGVTLVVGPLKEDLVIEVKSAGEKKKTVETKTTKTQTKTVQAPVKKTTSLSPEEMREKRIAEARKKAEERRNLQKKQKEVLPTEEK